MIDKHEVWIHKKSGVSYSVILRRHFKIPFLKKWITIVEYINKNSQDDDVFMRFEFDFNKKFRRIK